MKNLPHDSPGPGWMLGTLMASLMTCIVCRADATGQPQPPPQRPNVFERIGNFIYNITNRTERSMVPDYPVSRSEVLYQRRAPSAPQKGDSTRYLEPTPAGSISASKPSAIAPQKPPVPLPDTASKPGISAKQPGLQDKQAPKPDVKADGKDYLMATPGSKPGRAKSPYPPFRELDVAGLPAGSLAMDPVSGKIFRVP